MERLGMRRTESDDFDHPHVPDGHPLRRHVLYRLKRNDWTTNRPNG
jgi:RimJ/RimL family protein N-acetyltransferase